MNRNIGKFARKGRIAGIIVERIRAATGCGSGGVSDVNHLQRVAQHVRVILVTATRGRTGSGPWLPMRPAFAGSETFDTSRPRRRTPNRRSSLLRARCVRRAMPVRRSRCREPRTRQGLAGSVRSECPDRLSSDATYVYLPETATSSRFVSSYPLRMSWVADLDDLLERVAVCHIGVLPDTTRREIPLRGALQPPTRRGLSGSLMSTT